MNLIDTAIKKKQGPVYIVKNQQIARFLGKAIPLLNEARMTVQKTCPYCHHPITYPLMVSEQQFDAFEDLLFIARKYLAEQDAQEKMLAEILQSIYDRLNLQ